MKIIDAHLHFSEREHFRRTAETVAEVAFSAKGLRSEYEIAGVTAGIVMTSPGREPLPSSGYSRELELKDGSIENLLACIGVNPVDLSNDPGEELYLIEKELNMPYATGIKLYPGYFPFYVTDPLYKPIYRLAQKYKMPVAIHCGDTSSARAKLKYSHPMTVDEAAVEYPDITFVICHMGDPWVMDTAELISKNPNVYTDVSGMIAGNAALYKGAGILPCTWTTSGRQWCMPNSMTRYCSEPISPLRLWCPMWSSSKTLFRKNITRMFSLTMLLRFIPNSRICSILPVHEIYYCQSQSYHHRPDMYHIGRQLHERRHGRVPGITTRALLW